MRSFKSSALLVLLGAGLAVVVASRHWVTVAVSDEALPLTDLSFTGTELVPGAHALAVSALVLLLGMILVKSWVRRVFALFGIVASVVAIIELSRFLGNTGPVLAELIAQTLGRELVQSAVSLVLWPYLGIAGLVISVIGNIAIVVSRPQGGGLSNKYERGNNAAHVAQNPEKVEEINSWAALDAGIDPTI